MNKEVSQLITKIGMREFLSSAIEHLEKLEEDEYISELKVDLKRALHNYTFIYLPELLEENEELKKKLDRADTDFVALSEHYDALVNK